MSAHPVADASGACAAVGDCRRMPMTFWQTMQRTSVERTWADQQRTIGGGRGGGVLHNLCAYRVNDLTDFNC